MQYVQSCVLTCISAVYNYAGCEYVATNGFGRMFWLGDDRKENEPQVDWLESILEMTKRTEVDLRLGDVERGVVESEAGRRMLL